MPLFSLRPQTIFLPWPEALKTNRCRPTPSEEPHKNTDMYYVGGVKGGCLPTTTNTLCTDTCIHIYKQTT